MEKILNFVDDLLEKSTPEAPSWNIEQIIESKPVHWNYIDGCMLKAIFDLYYATNNKKYFDFAKNFVDYYILNEGKEIRGYNVEEYNCDNINPGKVLFDLYSITGDEKYKNSIKLQMRQLQNHPRLEIGNFWHKAIYPYQLWLDGLYMVQPFYMQYEMLFNEKKNYKDIFNQFKNTFEITRDKETGLFYHGYDEKKEMFWAEPKTGLSKNFWTRSIGWFAMALVDTIEKLDEQFFYEYEMLQSYLKDLLDSVLNFKDETNLFYQVTNMGHIKGNYLETSGSLAISYSFMKGSRLGFLPSNYFNKGFEIFKSIYETKFDYENFKLKDICLVAGLGGMPGKGNYKLRDGTFEYYVSEPRVDNDAKGVAPFLFCFAEILMCKNL